MTAPITSDRAKADLPVLNFEVGDIASLHAALHTPEQLSLRCYFDSSDMDIDFDWLQIDIAVLEGRLALEFSSAGYGVPRPTVIVPSADAPADAQ